MGLPAGLNTQVQRQGGHHVKRDDQEQAGDAGPEQSLVRHDVLGGPGGIAGRDEPVDREIVAEACQGRHEQQRNPGDEAGLADRLARIRLLLEGRRRIISVVPDGRFRSAVRHRGSPFRGMACGGATRQPGRRDIRCILTM
jgi:hypothetical protein